ncbi:response regulator [Aliiruegeria sabulilitoris]|uniref:response regulator n=1 Tax=Aliiruegeria sabulilitoris TaxID=1510458 RepID=UPI00082D5D29|nr:response regulator [Aliiruegeria sabulilitoris]NDR56865.1 response regulator [Pseudoruegeria sp. M32A2M]
MQVLIVESSRDLGWLWKRHIERMGHEVSLAQGQAEAIAFLHDRSFQVIILDVVLEEGSAFAVSDFASYRRPAARVIFVTNTSFFSDGSIFSLASNACAFLQSETPPEDLAAMVEYHGKARR